MEGQNGGSFGAGVSVGAWTATLLIGFVKANKDGLPGRTKCCGKNLRLKILKPTRRRSKLRERAMC